MIFERPDRQFSLAVFICTGGELKRFYTIICAVLYSCVAYAEDTRTFHIDDKVFILSRHNYTIPALHFSIDGEIWHAPTIVKSLPDTLHFNRKTYMYSLYNYVDGPAECNGEFFTDTENYTYDQDGWSTGATTNVYIEGTGTQFVDTEYEPTEITRTEIDLKFTSDTYKSSGGNLFFGTQSASSAYIANFGADARYQAYMIFPWICKYGTNGCNNIDNFTITATQKRTKQTFIMDAGAKYAQYATKSKNLTQNRGAPENNSILLFAAHNASGTANIYTRNNGMFIYGARFYEDGVLMRNFIPVPACMKIGDFVVPENGLWDTVEQKFYGNYGTGEFIYGQD